MSPPAHLASLCNSLFTFLQGCVPRDRLLVDSRGWGNSLYTVKKGYERPLISRPSFSSLSQVWKSIWNSDGMPKINLLLAIDSRKILMAENLENRGISGPSHFVLCLNGEESIQLMFINCQFTKEVWTLTLAHLTHRFVWPQDCTEYFNQWWKNYRGSFRQKVIFKRLWEALPKYSCWSIWPTRNKNIFKGEVIKPRQTMLRALSLLSEYMQFKIKWQIQNLNVHEEEWLKQLCHVLEK